MDRIVKFGFVLGLCCLLPAAEGATRTWTGSADNNWFNASNWNPVGVPATNDTIVFSTGTISLTAPVTINGVFNWSGGTLSGSPLTIATNGLLNLTGSGTKYVLNVLTNAGTVEWLGGDFVTSYYSGASYFGSVENLAGAVWDVQCNQSLYNNYGGGAPYFHNAGTVQKTAGTGTTAFSIAFNNAGLVSAQTGTINFNGGGTIESNFTATAGAAIQFNGGAFSYGTAPVLTGTGAILFTGGTLTLLNNLIPGLQLTGGTLSLGSSFQGGSITNLTLSGSTLAGDQVVRGTLNWNGGTMAGALTVTNGGIVNWSAGTAASYVTVRTNGLLNLTGSGAKYLQNVLTNAGTVEWLGGDFVTSYYSGASYFGSVENLAGAAWDIQCNQSVYNNYGGGAPYFHNAGTVQKTAGTGTTTFSVGFNNAGLVSAQTGTINFNGGGTIESNFTAATGAAIQFNGGAFSYATVPVLSGPGAFRFSSGTLTLLNNLIPGLQLTGGTLSLGSSFQGGTITNLTLNGSTLSGDQVVKGTLNWNGGTMSGALTVTNGGVVNWSGGTASSYVTVGTNGLLNLTGSITLQNVLTNAGTVAWLGGSVAANYYAPYGLLGSVENLPGGLWDIQCDQGMNNGYGGTSAYFHNRGTVQKSAGTGATTFSIAFNNAGLVSAQTGTINFNNGGTIESNFTAAAGAAIQFNGGAFSYATVPVLSGPGAFRFSSGTLTLLNNLIPGLQLTGGTLSLGSSFQGGTITNLTLIGSALNGTFVVSGILNCGNGVSGGLTVTNGGTLNWSGGTISGVLTIAGGGSASWSGGTASGYVTVGTNGLLNLTGSITLQNVLTNAGTVAWLGGSVAANNYAPYGLLGAVENLPGGLWDIQSDQSMYNGYGGTSAYFHNRGTVQKSAGTGATTFSIAFNNAGLVSAQTGTINFNNGGTIESNFTAAAGAAIQFNGGVFSYSTVPVLTGPGAIRFTAGTLTLLNNVIPGLQMTGGTLSLSPAFQGGTITNLNFGGSLSGSYTVSGTFTLGSGGSGTLTVSNGAVLNWSGGTLAGLALSNSAVLNWSGGTLSGPLNVVDGAVANWGGGTASGYVTVGTNGLLNLTGSITLQNVLTNAGTVAWLGGSVAANNYAPYGLLGSVENLPGGLWDIQSDQSMYNGYGGTSAYFHNRGTVQKSAGTGATTFSIAFNNAGLVSAQTGTINFNNGGTIESNFTAAAGAAIQFNGGVFSYSTVPVLTGPGAIRFTAGTLTLLNNVIPGLQMTGGTLNLGPAFQQGGSITNLSFGGSLSGSYTVGGTLTLGNGGSGTLTVSNGAVLNWSGGTLAGLVLSNSAVLNWSGGTLSGPLNVVDGAVANWGGGTASGYVTVGTNGLLNLTGSITLQNVLTNAGTVAWLGGSVAANNYAPYGLLGAVENLPGGLWDIKCDQTMYNGYGGTASYFHNSGTVQKTAGTGTTTLSIPFVNGGTLDVETGAVSFNLNNTYGQTAATLRFGLAGPANSGRVAIAGTMNFDGTLAAGLVGGYVPAAGDAISLVTYGSSAGTFNNLNLPPLSAALGWRVAYNASALQIQVVSNASTTAQITGSVVDNSAHAVTNVTVFAYTTNAGSSLYLSTVTDATGHYALNVTNGTWQVGLQGLPSRGYNPVANQSVTVNNANQTANFVLQPYSLQYYTISTAVNPPGAGTSAGDGVFPNGSTATVNATAITSALPYYFASWTENGVFESASPNYTFTVSRSRSLTANFTLPTYQISASNNPAAGGFVSGTGTYFYGTTNVLTATANYGYRFTNWTENGNILTTSTTFTNIVTSNRLVVANYAEANTLHYVTTATSPSGIATVTGAGNYVNGQTVNLTAPVSVTLSPYIYTFREFRLNGSLVGNSATVSRTVSTLDPTNMNYVAVYDTKSILPTVVGLTAGFTNTVQGGFTLVTNPVPVATNYQVALQFDRSMDPTVTPLVVITNSLATVQPVVPAGGVWFATVVPNDTYLTPMITFSTGMDGPAWLQASGARDPLARQMAPTNLAALVIDVTAPTNPVISLTASNSSSAQVSWSAYVPPVDLGSFRVFLRPTNFTSTAGLTPVSAAGAGARSFTFGGLLLDQPYYAAVAAVDQAGNSSPNVASLPFTLTSSVPPPVIVQATPVGASSALISWNSYNASQLLGFAGFQLFSATSNFTSVAGLTANQTLSAGTRSVQIDNLDRTKTNYFAVVGFNVNNAFSPNVTTASWSDPYAGNISVNTTLGGSGQSVVNILHSITIVNGAILTVPAGTTLRFAPGTGLTIQQGALFALGTALDPVTFTSAKDLPAGSPVAGDWNGITIANGGSASVVMNAIVKYGAGLTLDNCAPTVAALTASYNAPAGLTAQNGSVLNTADALVTFNGIGIRQLGSSQLFITNSVIQNNGTNALASGGLNLYANADWWGSATSVAIDATLRGAVDRTGFLTGVPVLTPAIGISNNVTQVGSQSVNLRLACRTADSMRLSEDSTFAGVFFSPFTNVAPFQLSTGGGQKTIFAQFRSLTGASNTPVSLTLNYVTAGPTINAFTLSEGQVLSRPVSVTGSATAPLGMAQMEFYVDGIGQSTNTGGSFTLWFDVRNFTSGTHRVELLARDTSGNIATLFKNIIVSPTPPPAPVMLAPATDMVVTTNAVLVSGTAEPFIAVRLFNSAVLAGVANASAAGAFTFAGVPLTEGANQLVLVAMDALGSASSQVRTLNLDTTPPAQLALNPPVYTPGSGLLLTWTFPATGKRASSFVVYWSASPITNPSQALGHTVTLSSMSATIQGLRTGDYYFYVVGYDAVANASPLSAPVTYHYDAVPPSFTVAFGQPSPVGVGPVHLVLTASEPLAGMPTMTVKPYGSTPALLTLANTTVNTYEADINVTTLLPSGPVQFNVSAQDLAGNPFNGAPSGPSLVIDVTPPSGVISIAPLAPVQATNNVAVAVNLQLTEPPGGSAIPSLSFGPPAGSPVPVTLSGSGTNWNGTLTVMPAMGSGVGNFSLSVTDALNNIGHSITAGGSLEIYNTALPTPPAQPVHFEATSLTAGQVLLTWSNVPNAEIYRVYSGAGNNFNVPTNLIADNVTSNSFVDLPVADGYYRYVVTASRRGSEGTNSIVRVALSDRTPPPAPTNVVVQLAATGMQIVWQAGAGATPDHFNVYRNGALIRAAGTATPVIDNPPRGQITYTVGAADALGNEALSAPSTIQLFVGAVNNLQALVDGGQSPALTWTTGDATAVGFNVYRNGIKQNSALLATASYADTFAVGTAPVTYAVTAVNATNAESAARSVVVYAANLGVLVNAAGGPTNNPPITSYFDDYLIGVTNQTVGAALPLQQVELLRSAAGATPLNLVFPVNSPVASGAAFGIELPVPCSSNTAPQTVRLRAVQQTDSAGSSVIYQSTVNLPGTQTPGVMLEVSANQLPLAGGLTPFNVRLYNRGYTPLYFVTSRSGGSQPGDLYLAVKNPQGQEVSRTPFTGTPSGVIFYGTTGYLMVPAGSSATLTVPGVLTPAALASNTVTFQGVVSTIYDRVTPAGQQASGPLSGTMQSALSQTPYYGTAHTDYQLYSGDQPIVISGQALNQASGLPVPSVPLQIGFATRGYRWYQNVTTDTNGNYSLNYNVAPGLAGTLTIWAAHPAVVDQLNQAQVTIYRVYASPPSGDIRMSKNDTLPFTISLLNPGDVALTGFTTSFQAYQLQGTNQVPITTVQGTNLLGAFAIAPGQRQTVTLQLAAAASAPDNAKVVFTLTSAEGATATFTGNVTLLPAVPIVSVVSPNVGYVEVSVDRGALVSRQVTIMNSGLKDLKGVSIVPPTNVNWMVVNLPAAADGTIPVPDLPVGASNAFTVVFTPPPSANLGFFQDKLTIRGTNAQAGFDVNLYARVSSSQLGAIQFAVDDILGLDVPNATVRLRNTALQVELPPVTTDINGLVTVTNLQEGDWSWQVGAPGYSANVGFSTVTPDQTVQTHTRLNKSLVTVTFTVTPVPFSDKYEITIEQTFETHVPIPVLIMTPAYQAFTDVKPGFQATFIATAKNEGLVQMTDLTITGQQTGSATLTPLITYVPVLGAQQSIDIPFTATYSGTNAPGQQGLGDAIAGCIGFGNVDTIADFIAGMAAFAQAYAQCPRDAALIGIATTVAVTMQILRDATEAAENLLAPVKLLGCILGNLIGPLNLPGLPLLGIATAPPSSSVQQFSQVTVGCFAAETHVLLADGTVKTIDQIKPGDLVKSGVSRREIATVAEVYQRTDNTCRDVRFALPAQSEPGTVRTTDEHLFWVDGQGWVAAAELKSGDWLMNETGQRVQIVSNERLRGGHEVYTLKLKGDSAFYANGILVHDLCGAWSAPARVGFKANMTRATPLRAAVSP